MRNYKQFLRESTESDGNYKIPITPSEYKHFIVAKKLNDDIKKQYPDTQMTLVGGACRDMFYRKFFGQKIQKNINDLDFSIFHKSNNKGLVRSELEELSKYITSLGYYNVIEELDFLHLKILTKADNLEIEYTSNRKEAYRDDSRNPDTSVGNIIDDIIRRDFTINAIYLDVVDINKDSVIVRPYNNESSQHIDHVKQKLLKTTTDNPEVVLDEDPLRVLRAIRFSGYGYDMDPGLESAVRNFDGKKITDKVAVERVTDELGKILEKGNVDYLIKSGFIKKIIKEFDVFDGKEYSDQVLTHIVKVIHQAREYSPEGKEFMFFLAALFHDIGKGSTGEWHDKRQNWKFLGHEKESGDITPIILKNLKVPNKIINHVTTLIKHHMRVKDFLKVPVKTIVRWLFTYDNKQKYGDLVDDVLLFNKMDWGGKPEEWQEKNKDWIKHDEIIERVNKIRDYFREIKSDYKKELSDISRKIGQSKTIENEHKAKTILSLKTNFIIGKMKNAKL